MRKLTQFLIINLLVFLYFESEAQVIRGNGKRSIDIRELSGFNEIIAQGNFDLILTQGEKEGIRIETDENLIELFQTRVDDKKLYITMIANIRKAESSNVYVSLKELVNIIVLNEVLLKSEDVIHFDKLSIFTGGMCQIELELFASTLSLQLVDGTYAHLKGYAENFNVEIHDETELNAFDMQTDNCQITSTGLTEAMIDVQKDLKLLVTGGSNLYYTGSPVVSERIFSSTGFIVKRRRKK